MEKNQKMKQRLLILCTGNSARSQMGEGLARAMGGDRLEVFSAGTKPSTVNPLAIRAMAEIGIDISQHRSKHLNEFLDQPFDYVLTVCDDAAEACPVFPGKAQRLHWSLPDPAAATGNEAERLERFREVRDNFATRFGEWVKTLPTPDAV
jgi:arsenate reductase